MVAPELKKNILTGENFPELPSIAREALLLSADGLGDARAAGASMAVGKSMRRALAAAAGFPSTAAPTLEDTAGALGIARFRRLLFAYACVQMFPLDGGVRLDRRAFWSHALACGAMAEGLAHRMGSRYRNDAFAAGLLVDVGKLAIDQCVTHGYGKVHAMAQAKGLYVLEAERIELGVDHALAGKWVAERWGMAEPVVLGTWLHHHDADSLDPDLFPVELIEIVALADLLAHRRAAGEGDKQRVSDAFEERRRKLGLNAGDLDAVMRAPVETVPTLSARTSESNEAMAMDHGERASLLRDARRYKGLYGFSTRAGNARTRMQILVDAADTLRLDYGLAAGTCFVMDDTGTHVDGAVWRVGGESRPISVPLDDEASATTAVGALQSLLRAVGGSEETESTVRHRAGLVSIPVCVGTKALGQIIYDTADQGLPLDEAGMADLLRFAATLGELVHRWDADRAREARGEVMATALLRQELNYRQSLREERLSSIGRMAAGAAHEINNPLAVIAGRAQILQSRAASPEDSKALETIIQQSRRASKILIDLMQFARPSQPRLESAPIGQVMHQVVSMLADRLKAKQIRIVEDYGRDVPNVRVDRHQMEQVFLNLIINAEQAMEGKGGTLSLRVWHMSQRDTVVVQVSDTGHGIPTDRLDRVFEPFFTAREEGKGSGLGLAVCHGIVENHRGTITVHSVPGEGTTLTISLPATAERVTGTPRVASTRPQSAPARSAPSPPVPPRRVPSTPPAASAASGQSGAQAAEKGKEAVRPSVLLADADEALCDVLREGLRTRGYEVLTASDGLEALASFLGGDIDLVLLNIQLKAVDGTSVLQQIRERHATVPIIGFADRVPEANIEQVERLGLTVCLRKPFEMRELLHHISHALGSQSVA